MCLLLVSLMYRVLCVNGSSGSSSQGLHTCPAGGFPCRHYSSMCVAKHGICNGELGCPDWSDEENCPPRKCSDEEFQCVSYPHMCINIYQKLCDGFRSCPDWSDEKNCPRGNCQNYHFTCDNGRCLLGKRCDGEDDCGDWSDERGCGRSCYSFEIPCPDGRCIDYSRHKCNGINDCGDWSDEKDCSPSPCDAPDWTHHRGKCYKFFKVPKGRISWTEARQGCRDFDSKLASISGPEDEKFLLNIMPKYYKLAYIGLQKHYKGATGSFHDIFRWDDGSPLIYKNWRTKEPNGGQLELCTMMMGTRGWRDVFCGRRMGKQYICMKHKIKYWYGRSPQLQAILPPTRDKLLRSCNSGEVISTFKFCDGQKDCVDSSDENECDGSCDATQYQCNNDICISLTFYCDGINDCGDNSDEETCITKVCSDAEWTCANGQCIEDSKRCDHYTDCYDQTDEENCAEFEICRGFLCYDGSCIPWSWVGDRDVDCDGYEAEDEKGISRQIEKSDCLYVPNIHGKVRFSFPDEDKDCIKFKCPDMYYKCKLSYCIPVRSVCDGYKDCPGGDDEFYCDSFVCSGYFRCQGQLFCIHPSQVCDHVRHCPQGDDERYCPQACPPSCTCFGRIITCNQNFTLDTVVHSDARSLSLSGVDLHYDIIDLTYLFYLTVLNLSHCQLNSVDGLFVNYSNLIGLDLSNNGIQNISETSFSSLKKLRTLDLSHNILLTTIETGAFSELSALQHLNLMNTRLVVLTDSSFTGLSGLLTLTISNTSIKKIEGRPLSHMPLLRHLDIRHNNIEQFSCCFLNSLTSLKSLDTHSYKFCCDSMRPVNLEAKSCKATLTDAISSCKDLLGTFILRFLLWLILLVALFGNLGVFFYRIKYERQTLKRSYGIFVANLSISDSLMGTYMLIIGIADSYYRDTYVSGEYGWRHGIWCKVAGFLSTMSSEASCIFITLITLDRFLAIKYPFGQIKFSRLSSTVCSTITWTVSAILGATPLFPPLDQWELYSQSSVCLALPFSKDRKPGWQFSTGVFIWFNFIVFLFIGLGQILIYRELKASTKIRVGGYGSTDAKVARRLFLVVFTDFLCWFPVGVMGIVALSGVAIEAEVFAWTAVAVLPVNSALNPILYTLPALIERWRKSKTLDKTETRITNIEDTPLPSHPSVSTVRKYVGKPSDDMETLAVALPELSTEVKCALLAMVITYLYDLKLANRRFEAVTDGNVYVSRCGEDISSVCLALKSEPDRCWLVDDVFYLTHLLKDDVHDDLDKEATAVDMEDGNQPIASRRRTSF